jgi:hypothetical protein
MRRRGSNPISVKVDVDMERDAVDEIVALPSVTRYLVDVGEQIGGSIVAQVPVVDGTMRASFSPSVDESGSDDVRLLPNSPFWHWLEYGTATSPVYRPIQRGVEAVGARYEAA